MIGRVTSRLGCALATCVDSLAVVLAWAGPNVTLTLAAVLHGLATFLAGWEPGPRTARSRSEVKLRLARLLTFCIPVVGALLAWATRNHHVGSRRLERERLARFHREFLDQDEERPERSPFTGDFERDVETLADADSFAAILEFGTPEHKQSALRRLAEMGEPQHIRLLRQCLGAHDPEIRLFAYGQLEQVESRLCAALDAARADYEEAPESPSLRAAFADAHAALAACGALDESISAWHAREAATLRRELVAQGRAAPEAFDGPGEEVSAAVLRTRAEAAFEARDFESALRIATLLEQRGEELPLWLDFVANGTREGAA